MTSPTKFPITLNQIRESFQHAVPVPIYFKWSPEEEKYVLIGKYTESSNVETYQNIANHFNHIFDGYIGAFANTLMIFLTRKTHRFPRRENFENVFAKPDYLSWSEKDEEYILTAANDDLRPKDTLDLARSHFNAKYCGFIAAINQWESSGTKTETQNTNKKTDPNEGLLTLALGYSDYVRNIFNIIRDHPNYDYTFKRCEIDGEKADFYFEKPIRNQAVRGRFFQLKVTISVVPSRKDEIPFCTNFILEPYHGHIKVIQVYRFRSFTTIEDLLVSERFLVERMLEQAEN